MTGWRWRDGVAMAMEAGGAAAMGGYEGAQGEREGSDRVCVLD